MKKTPRFLICHNPLVEQPNKFILCTRTPQVLFEVIPLPHGFDLGIQDLYQGSESEVNAALEQARKWYIAYLASGKK